MKTVDRVIINAKNKWTNVKERLTGKVSGDETLIVKVMLIVIAVSLGLMFREQIGNIMLGLFRNSDNAINNMFEQWQGNAPAGNGI